MRTLEATYESAIGKLGLDRQLSFDLAKHNSTIVQDTAWRIARCCDDHNLWFVNAPESGWLHGRYWHCRSKLCSYCLSNESRRRRRVLREALAAYAGTTKQAEWRFLTLTIENPHTSIHRTRQIVNEAWSKFRKRACFAAVQAGCKSEEFTLTKNGYHYHIHSLLHYAKKPDYQRSRFAWTECVDSSGGSSGKLFGYDTVDGYLIINFKQVRSLANLTNELCKYVTKSTSFSSLSNEALAELADTRRWHRMFEMLGKLRVARDPHQREKNEKTPIVHTKRLSDGLKTDIWWFEKKRSTARQYIENDLSYRFGAPLWSLPQIQAVIHGQSKNSNDAPEASYQIKL